MQYNALWLSRSVPITALPSGLRILIGTILAAAMLVCGSLGASADWINLSGAETSPNTAEITVLDDRVRIALEVYIYDIKKVPELIPDDWARENSTTYSSIDERMASFSQEKLQVIANGATQLNAELRLTEPRLRKDRVSQFAGMINPVTRQRAPEAPEDKRVLYVELDYPFEGNPDTLTIIPPKDDNGRSILPTGFIVYHGAVPVIDFRYLTDAVTLELDWDDPWYSKFGNPNLKRHHRWPMTSYLYVDPREVRHEAVIRLRDLAKWIDLDLAKGSLISAERQAEIRQKADQFLANANPVLIDGVPAEAASIRTEFLELSLKGVQVIEDGRDLDPTTAILGVILSYPTAQLPQEVSVEWQLFNDRVNRVPATSIDPAGPFASEVSKEDPIHTWKNHLLKYKAPKVTPVLVGPERMIMIPFISLGALGLGLIAIVFAVFSKGARRVIGIIMATACGLSAAAAWGYGTVQMRNPVAGLPGEIEASSAAKAILENTNAAFMEVDASRHQSGLDSILTSNPDPSLSGELERAINIKVQGGTTARVGSVDSVTVSDILPLETGDGFSGLAEWTALATGQHWGHSHVRTIKYRARIDLAEDQDEWRLAGLTVIDTELQP
ncbi:MAG: hypothetical protein ABJJ37_04520 [Roseibium sp.]